MVLGESAAANMAKPDYRIHAAPGKSLSPERMQRIIELFRKLDDAEQGYHSGNGLVLSRPDADKLENWFRRRPSVITADDKDGNVLGFASNGKCLDYDNAGYVGSLVVDERFRGRGIGRAILRKAISENRRKKLKTVLAVNTNNPVGLKLYESEGFKPYQQAMVLGEKSAAAKIDKQADDYEPPYDAAEIKRRYGEKILARLSSDPCHRWRMDTGIELIHREPDVEEFRRIIRNWKLMNKVMQRMSDRKSRELFGVGNMEHAKQLAPVYGEKSAATKIDIPSIYADVKQRYADIGYPVSGDKLVISSQPTYTNGTSVAASELKPNASGGNVQDDGTVRINPEYRKVMRHWKLKGSGRDFVSRIIGHELGHHIDRTVLSTPERSAERRKLLAEIAKRKFHTVYTDSYGKGTDKRKLDKELLAEYLSHKVNEKSAESIEDMAKPHYVEGSHGWDHIQDVLRRARRLKGAPLEDYERAAVMYHDSSLDHGDRETHEIDSANIARKELAGIYNKRIVERIAKAIARHRASYKGRRYTALDNLLAAADRDDPDYKDMLFRSYRYGLEHGQTHDEAVDHAIEHIPEKYGRGGYAYDNVPEIYMGRNRVRLAKMWRALEHLDHNEVSKIVSSRLSEKKAEMYKSAQYEYPVAWYSMSKKQQDQWVMRANQQQNMDAARYLKARDSMYGDGERFRGSVRAVIGDTSKLKYPFDRDALARLAAENMLLKDKWIDRWTRIPAWRRSYDLYGLLDAHRRLQDRYPSFYEPKLKSVVLDKIRKVDKTVDLAKRFIHNDPYFSNPNYILERSDKLLGSFSKRKLGKIMRYLPKVRI